MRLITLLTSLVSASAMAQYSGPESVEYDPAGDRYFVSNTSGGVIKVRTQAGAVSDFVTVSPAPYGLELLDGVLWACSGGTLKAYETGIAALITTVQVGGTFLNGLATDGTHLYATDFTAKRIYKVTPPSTVTTLVSNTVFTPNGIVYDPVQDRLVVVAWGSNAAITAVDKVTGAMSTLTTTSLSNIDGIAIDCLGNFLAASWSPDRITRYEPTFTQPGVDLGVTGLNNPADIDFDLVNNRICIPNSGNNTVTLFDLDCSNTVPERESPTALRAVPNPTSGLMRIEPPLSRDEPYLLLDARGLLVGGGTLKHGALLDISSLTKGIYTIELTRIGQRLRVVRE
ncbi:MAG: hypothetical protein IPF41_14455 [Flavobacteriales bacterium]|mgnify:CR=1 FL=1|nr:hypothetical protein [Flavobacteriales bacterium]